MDDLLPDELLLDDVVLPLVEFLRLVKPARGLWMMSYFPRSNSFSWMMLYFPWLNSFAVDPRLPGGRPARLPGAPLCLTPQGGLAASGPGAAWELPFFAFPFPFALPMPFSCPF